MWAARNTVYDGLPSRLATENAILESGTTFAPMLMPKQRDATPQPAPVCHQQVQVSLQIQSFNKTNDFSWMLLEPGVRGVHGMV